MMGAVITKIVFYGPSGSKELNLLVDTGATFTKIPSSIAQEIGIECKYETEVELSDGTLKRRKLGTVEVELEEVKAEVPVTVTEDEERTFIGYTTLEILGFKVNPVTRKLERARHIEL